MKKLIALLGLLILMPAFPLSAKTAGSDAALGERLVREVFANPASARLAKAFQAVHENGARDRDAELKVFKSMVIRDYTLSNFKVTREADVLVVTYTFAGQETIDGRKVNTKAMPRLTVFINSGGQWQCIAHANLTAAKK